MSAVFPVWLSLVWECVLHRSVSETIKTAPLTKALGWTAEPHILLRPSSREGRDCYCSTMTMMGVRTLLLLSIFALVAVTTTAFTTAPAFTLGTCVSPATSLA